METIEIQRVLVATDLGEASDRLVRTASSIAALTGAELHVVHVHIVPPSSPDDGAAGSRHAEAIAEAERRMDEQVQRALPPHFSPSSQMVLARPSPSEAIRSYAESLSCDLIVIGPHRGPLSDRPFLGTTADRLLSTAAVPCLIVRGSPSFPIERIGALVDFSPTSQRALDTATAWMQAFSGGERVGDAEPVQPEIVVGHIDWSPQGSAVGNEADERGIVEVGRAIERSRSRLDADDSITFRPEVLHAGDATEVVSQWVRHRDLSLLVLGTRGMSRLPYAYIGGLASAVARSAPCSVLLVPPDPAREEEGSRIRLRRIVTGVDFHDSSWEAALWAMRYFAPHAEHELIHVLDLPELPAPLRAFTGKLEQMRIAARGSAMTRLQELRDLGSSPDVGLHVQGGRPAPEIIRLAREVDADMIIVGEEGPKHGMGALLGSTAERVLFDSSVPVLVARNLADSPPRNLLVAIDASPASERVLEWTGALLELFDARATLVNVVDRVLLADELTGMPDVAALQELQDEATRAMREWLNQRIDESGLPTGRVEGMVVIGDPSYEIIAAARRASADLVLLGSREGDIARTPLIGRVVNKVVRSAPCSVMVATSRAPAAG